MRYILFTGYVFALFGKIPSLQLLQANIMMKNVVDVVLGGITYWAFGYGFSYGTGPGTNPFFGLGNWFVTAKGMESGPVFTTFLFQLSFATTATTIVSGGIAERCLVTGSLKIRAST